MPAMAVVVSIFDDSTIHFDNPLLSISFSSIVSPLWLTSL